MINLGQRDEPWSYFFHDFRLFHHLLGIDKLTSIEADETLQKRCFYNKPYEEITLVMDLSTNYLRAAPIDDDYLVWMDYDFGFNEVTYDDMMTIFSRFNSGTIFYMTLDFERPNERPDKILDELREQLPSEMTEPLKTSDLTPARWKRTIISLLEKTITQGMYGRADVTFLRMFSFEYRDTRDMYSLGGLIVARSQRRKIVRILRSWPFYCRDRLANLTRIPQFVMTKKERGYLDRKSHSPIDYIDEIGIPRGDFDEYRRFYRYLPIYSEVI